ncbi:outer membrane protein [Chenggangzhangella methanolivorans]|uniref:Porin family protein n=1 Tax=Chenggangzhangella methanolivorans TaxID=1437009 RepID=A0A9E6UP13_9HYPH|nr:outer membrane protein [Chenggangzhangella methanolivorans]QZN99224.1 porin family protein [Chenggangzhangella methanolivorans]
MLRIVSLAAAAVVFAAPAFAADLPAYEPAPAYAAPAPASTWTGGYVGAQAGYGWKRSDNKNGRPNTQPDGAVVGGYAGYDYQFEGSPVVAGVDTDLNYNTGSDRNGRVRNELKWSGATRAKIGYGMDRVMVYGAAGVAYGEVKTKVGPSSDSKTAVGYTVGGGVETMIADNVTARAEYRYNDYGTDKFKAGGGSMKSNLTENRVTAGVAYKFGGW